MIIKDILSLIKKERKKRKNAQFIRKHAVEAGLITASGIAIGLLFATRAGKKIHEDVAGKTINTVITAKDGFQRTKENVKDHMTDTMKVFHKGMKHIGHKAERVQRDIKNGTNEITADMRKTAKKIKKELK